MRAMNVAMSLLLGSSLLFAGCRSTRPELQTWGERGDENSAANTPPPSTQPKLVSAQEAALAAASARDCANYASQLAQKDIERGWTLLSACAGREDFTLLEVLASEPWLEKVKSPAGATLAARVIANRGGDVYGDIKVLQQQKVSLWTLEQALEKPKVRVNSTLLVRGELAEMAPAEGGGVTLKIVENSWHTSVATGEEDDTVMAVDEQNERLDGDVQGSPTPTGRTLFVSAGKLDPNVKTGQDWLLVVTFNAAQKCKGQQSDAPLCGTAKLLTIGKPAAKLRDNW
jgi:hypothetical protein